MGNEVSKQSGRAEEVALLKAVLAGDVTGMQALMQQKPGIIYAHSKDGENIWHAAAQGGHLEVVKAVHAAVEAALSGQKKQDKLRAQVNHGFNQVNQAVNQVIASTVPLPLPAALNLPMGASLDINAQTREGLTPLMTAAKAGHADVLAALLEQGADAWLGDNNGATALHHSTWAGHTSCLGHLLRHAAKEEEGSRAASIRLVETATNTGLTPLHWAAWRGQSEAVKMLVNAGAAIAAPSSSDTMGMVAANAGSTPLHLAAMKGDAAVIRLLLRANKKLMQLCAADPLLAAAGAAAGAAGGAQGDLRLLADSYGKTAGRLAWDMQRSDLALILDPKTPLEQAVHLAAAAAAAATQAVQAATAAAPAAQQMVKPDAQQDAQQHATHQYQTPVATASPHSVRSTSSIKHLQGRQAGETALIPAAGGNAAAAAIATASSGTVSGFDDDQLDGFAGFVCAPMRLGPEPPPHLTCPITNEVLKDPVVACDGVAYEREAIKVWFQLGNRQFPGGHATITNQVLTPDAKLREEAVAWTAAHLSSSHPAPSQTC